jgi:dolichol-phosphate mannosyltransferase
MTYSVVLPVFNEEKKICRVIEKLKACDIHNIVVVDDGSTDSSAKVCEDLGAHVISLGSTIGVGRALVTGMNYVKELGHEYCVIMAGNDKDDATEIPRLLEPIIAGDADFVQGSRWLEGGKAGGDMPLYRRFATRLHPFLFSAACGKDLTESTNGFRAFRLSLLDDERINLGQKWLDGYEMEPYFLFKVIVLKYRHLEVPCTKIYPAKKLGNTKMRPFVDWWNILKPIFLLGLRIRK